MRSPKPRNSLAHRPAKGGSALLVLDLISEWTFPDADKLLPQALKTAPSVARLMARCRQAGVPVIYGNDNHGAWQSDRRQVVESSLAKGGAGSRVTAMIAPADEDYFVLKPKHSAFFQTPLDLLLQHLGVRRLILAGVASDQCVVATAIDARMRDLEVIVASDCVASQTPARNRRALEHFKVAMAIATTPAAQIRVIHGR